jgi:hypothetical protein
VSNFLTVLFGFLVTAWLVAPKLSRSMAVLFLLLFVSLAATQALEIWFINSDVNVLADEIRARAAAGDRLLAGHGAATTSGLAGVMTAIRAVATVGAISAAVVFFVYRRRRAGTAQES